MKTSGALLKAYKRFVKAPTHDADTVRRLFGEWRVEWLDKATIYLTPHP